MRYTNDLALVENLGTVKGDLAEAKKIEAFAEAFLGRANLVEVISFLEQEVGAKVLKVKADKGTKSIRLVEYLLKEKLGITRTSYGPIPQQPLVNKGYLVLRPLTYKAVDFDSNSTVLTSYGVFFTPAGLQWFKTVLKKYS